MSKIARSDLVAVLDACVLFPASLRDTLLRLAETPKQYTPKWSAEILEEVARNLENRRNLAPEKTAHLIGRLERHFPEARVTGHQKLIGAMTNHPKDRHVVAAAVQSGARVIVTRHPDDFLLRIDQEVVMEKLRDHAATIERTLTALLRTLHRSSAIFPPTSLRGSGWTSPTSEIPPFL